MSFLVDAQGCNDQGSYLVHAWPQLNEIVIRLPFSLVQMTGLINSHFYLCYEKIALECHHLQMGVQASESN